MSGIYETLNKNAEMAVTLELLISLNKILNKSWFLYGALNLYFYLLI